MRPNCGRALALAFALAVCPVVQFAYAEGPAADYTIHQDYVSTRALGMGNAFTAVVDDMSAMFYNPALLAWRTRGELKMFVRGGTTPASLKLFDEINEADKATDPELAYSDLIKKHYGEHFYYRVPTLGAAYVRPNWGLAFIPADLSLDASVHRNLGPSLNVTSFLDSTLAYTYARKMNWFGRAHQTSWGVTLKSIHRFHISEALLATDLAQNASVWDTSLATEGLTIDADASLAWRPPLSDGFFNFLKYARPSFALVGRNLGDYGYPVNFHLLSKQSETPPRLGRRMDFGTKWEFPKVWVFESHAAVDVRDIGHPNFTMRKGLHAGFEAYWRMYNWWRGHWSVGANQGYLTAGFGARLAWFQLDLATYGEEVGTINAPKQSRRYMAELALDF